jgi:hypothetical protein
VRDLDGRIGDRILERPEQQTRFFAAPTAVFDDVCSRPNGVCDLVGAGLQEGQLGPCQVILGLSCNRLEQRRAAAVIEVLGGQPLGALPEASEHIAQDVVGSRSQVGKVGNICHASSLARRTLENRQQAGGGKKLR